MLNRGMKLVGDCLKKKKGLDGSSGKGIALHRTLTV